MPRRGFIPPPPKPAEFAEPIYRPRKPVGIRTRPSLDFSLTGLVYCLMLLFMGVAAINTQANLLFGVFGLMIGVLLISLLISRWVLRNLSIRRVIPDYAAVGAPMRITYEVDNKKRWWPSLSVTIAELDAPGAFDRQPHAYVMHAAAGMRATVHAEVVPMRRGIHRFERYQVSTSFPFGFIRRAMRRRQEETVLIHPAQGAVEPTAMMRFLSADSSGLSQKPREGGADEFYGAREYRPGDPMRMIHWRRSARTSAIRTPTNPHGSLVVKQMTRVSPPRLLLLVDTYAPPFRARAQDDLSAETAGRASRQQQLADIELNLATAASLLSTAARYGLRVGVLAGRDNGQENPWLEVQPERGKRHARDVLAQLAEHSGNTRQDADALLSRGLSMTTRGDTTLVFITSGRRGRAAGDAVAAARRSTGRGNVVTIHTATPDLARWIQFDASLDFAAMIGDEL